MDGATASESSACRERRVLGRRRSSPPAGTATHGPSDSASSEPPVGAAPARRGGARPSRRRTSPSAGSVLGCVKFLRANADDRLSLGPLGRVEGGDGVVEGRDVADVGPQSSVPHALDDLTQLGAIGLDDEVDCPSVGGPRLGRPYDGYQGPPARIRRVERFWMSPPITSNTRSTPPASSRASLSRSMNSCAPKSRAFWRSVARPVPMT